MQHNLNHNLNLIFQLLSKSRGEGRGAGGSAQGDSGAKYCVCPKCEYSEKHEKTGEGKSVPCTKIKCPKCGAAMIGSDTSTIQKPYPNFHAARVKSPGLFLRVRVMETSKEGIMFYGGPLKTKPGGGAQLQSVRFPKDKFTAAEAKKWLKDHEQKYVLFEPAIKKNLWPSFSKGLVNG